jgi:hypothetical protein
VVKIGYRCRPPFFREAGVPSLAFGTLLDRVHPVWIESHVVPDGAVAEVVEIQGGVVSG